MILACLRPTVLGVYGKYHEKLKIDGGPYEVDSPQLHKVPGAARVTCGVPARVERYNRAAWVDPWIQKLI